MLRSVCWQLFTDFSVRPIGQSSKVKQLVSVHCLNLEEKTDRPYRNVDNLPRKVCIKRQKSEELTETPM